MTFTLCWLYVVYILDKLYVCGFFLLGDGWDDQGKLNFIDTFLYDAGGNF